MPARISTRYVDCGLDDLPETARGLLEGVLDAVAKLLVAKMAALIVERGFFDTGATANSVQVQASRPLERDVGPTTEYAINGELGWSRKYSSGKVVSFAGLHFAKDALDWVEPILREKAAQALARLGKGGS